MIEVDDTSSPNQSAKAQRSFIGKIFGGLGAVVEVEDVKERRDSEDNLQSPG